jgi:hypothetical protein
MRARRKYCQKHLKAPPDVSDCRLNKHRLINSPQNIVTNLHTFRFMGNIAVHELTPPKRQDLLLAIEISEDLLNFLYELDYKAVRLSLSRQSGQEEKTSQDG